MEFGMVLRLRYRKPVITETNAFGNNEGKAKACLMYKATVVCCRVYDILTNGNTE